MPNPFALLWKWILKVFDANARDVAKLRRRVPRVNALETQLEALDKAGLGDQTRVFRERMEKGEALDALLPEAFATVREASKRTLGMRHFDVQLIGGAALHQGRISEMATGEGKTLVATLPLYLNALTGKGVHLVTVNDYLARRDAMWMGPIYLTLGLKVGILQHDSAYLVEWDPTGTYGTKMVQCSRKDAYAADILYGTNSEFGFDYLRDNMVYRLEDKVQRPLNYAIVDEVDSILIDEARTPLIISGMGTEDTTKYLNVARVCSTLDAETDVEIKEKENAATPSVKGMAKLEKAFNIKNLYDFESSDLNHLVFQALKARYLMKADRDYVVKDGEIIIVDEFTGRLMFGRRFSDGLHQAIEAKEGVPIRAESQTMATITIQNYFRMYKKLGGMTGTAKTEEKEFIKIYGMDVVVIPTNRPLVRRRLNDQVYKSEPAKFRAVVTDLAARYHSGQPVLIGTTSVEKSELLSELLHKQKVPHTVLNAKYHEREAEIVAQAGRYKAITVATNMAGRGTDILLGGNPTALARDILKGKGVDPETNHEAYLVALEEARGLTAKEHDQVVALGGLHVLGTERHEARRIDNQLRGRAGRQGDPGSSQFFLSLEDDIMRKFGQDRVKVLMEKYDFPEDEPLEHGVLNWAIETVQKRVESHNFEIRKNLLKYDDILNKQREVIYAERDRVLNEPEFHQKVYGFVDSIVVALLNEYVPEKVPREEWRLSELHRDIHYLMPVPLTMADLEGKEREALEDLLKKAGREAYDKRVAELAGLGPEIPDRLARMASLKAIDQRWLEHLDEMEHLRDGVSMRGYANIDPLVIYAKEGFELFQTLLTNIQKEIVRDVFLAKIEIRGEFEERQKEYSAPDDTGMGTSGGGESKPRPKPRPFSAGSPGGPKLGKAGMRVGRNDPCWCASGKKYKKCHMDSDLIGGSGSGSLPPAA
ncbi:MAG: preprotein translocase subunit SecA [bacterium]